MVTVVVLDCPCGPAWGPDCCMSNAVGMMREDARRRLDAIPRGCPEMRGGHAPRRRARRQRAKSAVRTRGHALPSECARRAAVSGSAFLGLAPCSGAGRFARAGLETRSERGPRIGLPGFRAPISLRPLAVRQRQAGANLLARENFEMRVVAVASSRKPSISGQTRTRRRHPPGPMASEPDAATAALIAQMLREENPYEDADVYGIGDDDSDDCDYGSTRRKKKRKKAAPKEPKPCLLYTSPSPRDRG